MDSDHKKSIFEDYLRFRVKAKPDSTKELPQVPISRSIANKVLADETNRSVSMTVEALNTIRTLSRDRSLQYKAYDEMEGDTTISSALDMYADDATQYDTSGRRIWIESDDSNVRDSAMYYLRLLRIDDNCWDHIRALTKYGDLYLETFREVEQPSSLRGGSSLRIYNTQNKKESGYLEEYVQALEDPSVIYDLQEKGKSAGYLCTPQEYNYDANSYEYNRVIGYNREDKNNKLYSPDKFVHIMLRRETTRYPETITLQFGKSSENTDEQVTYKVRRGKSILHDIYKSYQELSLLEDSLILNRVNKSAIVRLLQVEVGDMPKNQVSLIMRRLKEMMENKFIVNKNTNEVRSTINGGPLENIVYIPTRNGKGAITAQTLGGDVDVKSIADIEYVGEKVYSGLKIPKQMLGKSDSDNGGLGNGGSSLSKKDSRYARTIKAVQSAYISGITDLLNMFFLDKGLDSYVNSFRVRMVSPSTIEDAERDETANTRLDIADKIVGMLKDNLPEGSSLAPVINWILTSYVGGVDELAETVKSVFGDNESDDPDEMSQLDQGDVDDSSDMSYDEDDYNSDDTEGRDPQSVPSEVSAKLSSSQQSELDDYFNSSPLDDI